MLFYKRAVCIIAFLGLFQFTLSQTTSEDLVGIHTLTQTQINALNNPQIGTLVYNTDLNALQAFTGGAWAVPESISTFVDNGDDTFTYTNENGETITIGTIGPQGVAGPKGDTGDTGAIGGQGIQGETGPQGVAGPKGDTGDTGSIGPQGIQGEIGPQGPPGNSSTKLIDVYDSNSSYTVPKNTFVKVRFNSTRINLGGVFTIGSNEITVNEAGTYEIEYGVAGTTNVWSSLEAKIRINTTYLTATSSYNGGWYKRVTATRKVYQTLAANDVISIWVQRTDYANSGSNAVNTLQNGSFLLVRKLD